MTHVVSSTICPFGTIFLQSLFAMDALREKGQAYFFFRSLEFCVSLHSQKWTDL